MKNSEKISLAQQIKSLLMFAYINIISDGEKDYTLELTEQANTLGDTLSQALCQYDPLHYDEIVDMILDEMQYKTTVLHNITGIYAHKSADDLHVYLLQTIRHQMLPKREQDIKNTFEKYYNQKTIDFKAYYSEIFKMILDDLQQEIANIEIIVGQSKVAH
jgi:archaellum component FlaC